MPRGKSIEFKLILFFFVSGMFIFLLIFSFTYRFSRHMIEKNVEESARNLTQSTVNKIETILSSAQKVPENLAYYLENSPYDKEQLLGLLKTVVEKNSEVYGSTVAFEPYSFERGSLYFAPYYYKSAGEIKFSYLGGAAYRYFYLDWYQIPKELGSPVWSEPYFDVGGGNIIMATYSAPFYKTDSGKRRFTGIVTADISLEWLRDIVSSIKILDSGYGFLISRNGTIVTHPLKDLIMHETIFSVAEERDDALLRRIGRKMISGESGFVPPMSIVSGKKSWMYYAPIPSTGWSLAVLFPQDEFMADIIRLNRAIAVLGTAGLLLLLGTVVFIARSIAGPLRAMAKATQEIATGNLDVEVPSVRSDDEVGKLAQAFEYMKVSLKRYIKELTETTAAKQKIESELSIAHHIQMSMLPKVFPPFPERREFDIYAFIETAKEVGGDLYDFYFIDKDRLCFVIGDVLGKGISSALFMAMTTTLFKATAAKGIGPDRILAQVDAELKKSNDEDMFLTAFLGILNTKTGEVVYANGGHNPPFIIRRNSEAVLVKETAGKVIGAYEGMDFETGRFILEPGETLFMYTDGVTEAKDDKGGFFSEERLKKKLDDLRDLPLKEVVSGVSKAIKDFSCGTAQSDDITIMALKFNGEGGSV
jgi:sigma-B regulation protein RsbU (phosphoserine phosphatase)